MPDVSLIQIFFAAAVTIPFGLAAYRRGSVDRGGMIGGICCGFLIFAILGWRGFLLLGAFFVGATIATKHKREFKESLGVAQEKGGRRGWRNAVANTGFGVLLALVCFWYGASWVLVIGFVAAFATAFSDTVASELGQVYGKRAVLVTNFQRVPVGTEGAVSIEGTLLGIGASVLLGLLAWLTGFLPDIGAVGLVVLAAFIGTTVESYLGATIEGLPLMNNETINFLNTAVGGVSGMLLAAALGYQ